MKPLFRTEVPVEKVVRIALEVPVALYDLYAEQGIAANRTPEQEILYRLNRCKQHTASTPLYFDDAQRGQLQSAIGRNLSDASEALIRIKQAVSLDVGDVKIELQPRLTQRLRSRVFRGHTWDGCITKWVTEALEVVGGIRPA